MLKDASVALNASLTSTYIYIYLIKVDFVKVEPFADEDDNRPAKLVRSALVETSYPGHFRQVFRFGTAQQPLVSFVMLFC